MKIDVHAEGPLTSARQNLATLLVRETLQPVEEDIRSVSVRVPSRQERSARLSFEVEVELFDGRKFNGLAADDVIADGIEHALHAARRGAYRMLGRPLPERISVNDRVTEDVSHFDRRKSA